MVQDGRAFKPSKHRYPSVQITKQAKPRCKRLSPGSKAKTKNKKSQKFSSYTHQTKQLRKISCKRQLQRCSSTTTATKPNSTTEDENLVHTPREDDERCDGAQQQRQNFRDLQIFLYAPPFPLLRCTTTSLPVKDCLLPSTLTKVTLYSFRTYLIALQELK
jgi:hypothetical protein